MRRPVGAARPLVGAGRGWENRPIATERVKEIMPLFVLFLSLFLAVPAWAESAYVTDRFEITLRTGPGTQHKILKMLPSGARLEVLERNDEGYVRVRTGDGVEGWVLARYLQEEPVARERLAQAQARLDRLRKEVAALRRENGDLKKENARLQQALEKAEAARAKAEAALARIREASRNVIALQEENEQLKTQLVTLRRDLLTLRQENATLQDVRQRDWFLAGALVLALGIVAGLVLPRLAVRRRRSWSDL